MSYQLSKQEDGVSHININFFCETELGKLMSNPAHTPFKIKRNTFKSLEGYWFWLLTKEEQLKNLYGMKAKKIGQEFLKNKNVKIDNFNELIINACHEKVEQNPKLKKLLIQSHLPFEYYHFNNDKELVNLKEKYSWLVNTWEDLRIIYKNYE